MEKYCEKMNKQKALDFAIRDKVCRCESEFGYTINGRPPYNNYLSNDAWEKFCVRMSEKHQKYYEDADGGELKEKKGRWGIVPPKMASYGSSSRFIYLQSKDIENFIFEKPLSTRVGRNPANLDGYLQKSDCDIYVEAKCREIYASHQNQKIANVYKDVYESIHKMHSKFDCESSKIEGDDSHFKCTFKYDGTPLVHFDIKQLICHFLGIAADILENKNTNKKIKFVYLIFDPKDANFENKNISKFKKEIVDDYNATLEEIKKFKDFKWLFDAVLQYQIEKRKLAYQEITFDFKLVSQKDYKKELN